MGMSAFIRVRELEKSKAEEAKIAETKKEKTAVNTAEIAGTANKTVNTGMATRKAGKKS